MLLRGLNGAPALCGRFKRVIGQAIREAVPAPTTDGPFDATWSAVFKYRGEERCTRYASLQFPSLTAYMRACGCPSIHVAGDLVAQSPCHASWSQRSAAISLSGRSVRKSSSQREHNPSHGNILPDTSHVRSRT